MRLAAVFVVLAILAPTRTARADDPPSVVPLELPDVDLGVDLGVRATRAWLHDPGEPLLHLDPVPRPSIVGLGVTEDTQRTAIMLGKRATLTLSGTAWTGSKDASPRDGVDDTDTLHGTRAAVALHYDAGWLQLDAELSQNTLSSRYGGGAYRDVSLTISKSKRFSRWVTGWIGLTIGNRQWQGVPPPGEARSETHLMLSIGGTFR